MEPETVIKQQKNASRWQRDAELSLARNERFKPPPLPLDICSSGPGESLNTIQQSNRSVWTKYTRKYEMGWDGLAYVAQREEPLGKRVLVRQASKEGIYHKLRLLAQFRRKPYFPEAFEVFFSGSMMNIVCEYVDLALVRILRCPRFPTEKEAAAIAGQGSLLYTLCPSIS